MTKNPPKILTAARTIAKNPKILDEEKITPSPPDNAAMIAMTAYYKYLDKDFVGQNIAPLARYEF